MILSAIAAGAVFGTAAGQVGGPLWAGAGAGVVGWNGGGAEAAGGGASGSWVSIESSSAPMLDGTPTLLVGEPLGNVIRLDGPSTLRLLEIEEVGSPEASGPAQAVVTYLSGRDLLVEPVFYWRLAAPRAPSLGQVAEVTVQPLDDGWLSVSVLLAHRTDRPIGSVDHASLALTLIDPHSGTSAVLSTWGEWIEGPDRQWEQASLSAPIDCVSLTEFMAELPPGSPMAAALAGGPPARRAGRGSAVGAWPGSDLLWLLQGQGIEGDYTFSAWGTLAPSESAVQEVGAIADALGWTTAEAQGPELDPCSIWQWPWPPIVPCIWIVEPVPANPPPATCLDFGFVEEMTWSGRWSQSGLAGASGARLAKDQVQAALPGQLWFSPWSPGGPCIGHWSGDLVLGRIGICGTCPCAARVEAAPESVMFGRLDAIASVDASLHASVGIGAHTTATSLRFTRTLDLGAVSEGWLEQILNGDAPSRGVEEFRRSSGATPGPLDVEVGCGALLHVTSAFLVQGWTKLSVLADAPSVPRAELRITGRTKLNLKVTPLGQPEECGSGPIGIIVWEDPEF